jgi:hypothetical protein
MCLNRADDPHAEQFRSLLDSHGLLLSSTGPTHKRGGTLDAIASTVPVDVAVADVGISDHHAIRCSLLASTQATVSASAVTSAPVRPWRRLDEAAFRASLASSRLCCPEAWPTDVYQLRLLYTTELDAILDQLLPSTSPPTRRRPTDPWFDAECRVAKRATQRLERAYASSCRRSTSGEPLH